MALREDTLVRAPESLLNGPNGPRRTLVPCRLPMGKLRAISACDGATLNDVALAVASGALRRLVLECGEAAQPLKAMIPVNVRSAHEHAELRALRG